MRHTDIRRMLSLTLPVLISVTILVTSCTKSVKLSSTDLRDADAEARRLYRVTTLDDRIYEFKRYSMSNDTLILHHPFIPYSGVARSEETDVSIPLPSIKSVERVQWDPLRSFLVIGAIASLPFLLLLLMGPVSAG
jgi:hypothetical protein